ncbi:MULTISPECIES: glycosyltransferase [Bacilli]|uniref:glycosyltransferase n=1 Tax=Bacilli TaxID=91061 RepID=UPI0015A23D91|nr:MULTISPECIES: glycosyltransferase [Bacilli]MCI1764312.1 glycosyltransferase [Heyndrickxia oleronia]NVZ01650.1 glycosyltransferase [Pediococcus pentosaceus]
MKSVLVVGDYIKGSGLTNYLIDIYSHIDINKFNISCLSYSGVHNVDKILEEKNWKKYDVTPVGEGIANHLKDWYVFFKNHSNDFDEIHFNYSSSWNFFAVTMAKIMTNSKIIIQSHNNYYSKIPRSWKQKNILGVLNFFGKKIFNLISDKKLAVSDEAAKWMFGNKKNVTILKNGIDLEKYRYSDENRKILREKLKIKEDVKLIGFVGTLEERKNPIFALKCVEELDESFNMCMFGQGILESTIKKEIEDSGLDNKIKMMGVSDDLNKWYSAFDIFLFPSKTEGFGFALLEAQANGLKCLTSTSIPYNAKVTEDVVSIDLTNKKLWIDELTRINIEDREFRSQRNRKIIQKKGFSVIETSKEFENILLEENL